MLLTRHHRDVALIGRRLCRVKVDGVGGLDIRIDLQREIDRIALNHAEERTRDRSIEGPSCVGNVFSDVEDLILRRECDLFWSCLDRLEHGVEKREWLHRLLGKFRRGGVMIGTGSCITGVAIVCECPSHTKHADSRNDQPKTGRAFEQRSAVRAISGRELAQIFSRTHVASAHAEPPCAIPKLPVNTGGISPLKLSMGGIASQRCWSGVRECYKSLAIEDSVRGAS